MSYKDDDTFYMIVFDEILHVPNALNFILSINLELKYVHVSYGTKSISYQLLWINIFVPSSFKASFTHVVLPDIFKID